MVTERSTDQPESKSIDCQNINHEKCEHISDLIGSWGSLQKRLFVLLSIVYCASPYNNVAIFFYATKSDIICLNSDGSETKFAADKCSFTELNSCSSWYHNTTRDTVNKEWNLICERYWLRSVVLSAYQFGYLISGLLVGYISDRFGRKLAILLCLLLEIVCSLGLILSPNVTSFIVIRVFHGIGGNGRFFASLILLLESVGPKLRGRVSVSYEWNWYIGEYLMMAVTYNVMNWKSIYMGTMIFQILCIGIVWIIPESARWQLVVGQTDKAEKTLRLYAKKDKMEHLEGTNGDMLFKRRFDKLKDHLVTEKRIEKSKGFFDLLRSPRTLRYCFALYAIWFLRTLIDWGLFYSTLDFSGNVFVNNAIILSASVATNAFMNWKIDSFKRKSMLITMFLATSLLLCASIPVVESDRYIVIRMILIALGKFFSSGIYILLYVYTSELFPTSIRHFGLGTCSFASRIASVSAPFLAQLTTITSLKFTFGLFVLMGIIGASAAYFLPETKDKEIPDTIEGMIEMHSINDQS